MTAGLGGHTRAIAERLESGFVLACDRDADSIELAKENTAAVSDRVRFFHGAFSKLPEALQANGVEQVDGVLADLGVSRYQLSAGERGFSLMEDGPLDMRMDRSQDLTAADLVNQLSEKDLADLIYQLGEERRSRRISRAIVRARPILTTGRLAQVIEEAVPRTGRIHPATQTFMALRLAGEQRAGGARGTATDSAAVLAAWRTICGFDFYVGGGPDSETRFPGASKGRRREDIDQTRGEALG